MDDQHGKAHDERDHDSGEGERLETREVSDDSLEGSAGGSGLFSERMPEPQPDTRLPTPDSETGL